MTERCQVCGATDSYNKNSVCRQCNNKRFYATGNTDKILAGNRIVIAKKRGDLLNKLTKAGLISWSGDATILDLSPEEFHDNLTLLVRQKRLERTEQEENERAQAEKERTQVEKEADTTPVPSTPPVTKSITADKEDTEPIQSIFPDATPTVIIDQSENVARKEPGILFWICSLVVAMGISFLASYYLCPIIFTVGKVSTLWDKIVYWTRTFAPPTVFAGGVTGTIIYNCSSQTTRFGLSVLCGIAGIVISLVGMYTYVLPILACFFIVIHLFVLFNEEPFRFGGAVALSIVVPFILYPLHFDSSSTHVLSPFIATSAGIFCSGAYISNVSPLSDFGERLMPLLLAVASSAIIVVLLHFFPSLLWGALAAIVTGLLTFECLP